VLYKYLNLYCKYQGISFYSALKKKTKQVQLISIREQNRQREEEINKDLTPKNKNKKFPCNLLAALSFFYPLIGFNLFGNSRKEKMQRYWLQKKKRIG